MRQLPTVSAAISSTVAGAGRVAPGGRHSGQTTPPAGTEKAPCGPGVPQTAQSVRAGAHPAVAIARSRKASSTNVLAWSAAESARSAPSVSWNRRSDGSCSIGVSRSAVSAMALAAV